MSSGPLTGQPALRPEVILGPARRRGTRVVHYLKDPHGRGYLCVGVKEFFVISRLDGRNTLSDIGTAYAEAFDRVLGPEHWQSLFAKLVQRGLLVGNEPVADRVPARRGWRSLLYHRFPLVHPDALLGRLVPRIGLVFHPGFVLPALLAVLLMEVYVGTHVPDLYHAMRRTPAKGLLLPLIAVVGWGTLFVHEACHGLACKRFGGAVPEVGLLWRFPVLGFYCNADDMVLFRRRRYAVYTAFAGMFGHLIALLPLWLVWELAPQSSRWKGFAGGALLFCSIGAVSNAIPFLRLDGYYMLSHALGLTDLHQEANRFCLLLLRRDGPRLAGYRRRDRWIYGCYGAGSALFTTGMSALALWYVQTRLGAQRFWILLSVLCGLALCGAWVHRRRRRPARRRPGGL